MRTWVIVLALVACKKRQEPPPTEGAGSAVVVAAADAQPVDNAAVAPPDAIAPATADTAAGPLPVDTDELLDEEAIGPLRWGMPQAEVIQALGNPRDKTAPVEEGATGEFASTWNFGDIMLEMVSDTRTGPAKVRLITLTMPRGPEARGPSTFATARGIKLGSSRAQVAAAYPRSDEGGDDPTQYLVGSPYGGLLFVLKNDTVAEILLGPMAF